MMENRPFNRPKRNLETELETVRLIFQQDRGALLLAAAAILFGLFQSRAVVVSRIGALQAVYHPSDRDEAVEELNAALQSAAGSLKEALGDNLKVSYNVVSAEDLSASKLLELRQSYSVYDIDVDGAKEVDVEMTVTATALDLSGTYTLTVPVVQVGRSWYLDAENFRIYSFSSFW